MKNEYLGKTNQVTKNFFFQENLSNLYGVKQAYHPVSRIFMDGTRNLQHRIRCYKH